MNELYLNLLNEYKELRKKEKITTVALGKQSQVGRESISKIEAGNRIPSVDTFLRMLEPMGYKLKIIPLNDDDFVEITKSE